jgi:uncharacterized protein YacL
MNTIVTDSYFLKNKIEVDLMMSLFAKTFYFSIFLIIVAFFIENRLFFLGVIFISLVSFIVSMILVFFTGRYLYQTKKFHVKCIKSIKEKSTENYIKFANNLDSIKSKPIHNIFNLVIDKEYIAKSTYRKLNSKN